MRSSRLAAAFVLLTNYAVRPLVVRLNAHVLRGEAAMTTYIAAYSAAQSAAATSSLR